MYKWLQSEFHCSRSDGPCPNAQYAFHRRSGHDWESNAHFFLHGSGSSAFGLFGGEAVKRILALFGLWLAVGYVFLAPAIAHAAGGTCPTGANYLNAAGATTQVTLASIGVTSCYYASATGVDTATGTDEAHPWLHLPGMAGCANNCSSVTVTTGEGFIIQGGSTYHFSGRGTPVGLPWSWGTNGTTGNPIYLGVDPTWFSGGSWTRPVFTGDNSTSTSSGGVASCSHADDGETWISVASSTHIITDNFEAKGMCWNTGGGLVIFNAGSSNSNTWTRDYVHGWTRTTGCTASGCAEAGVGFSSDNGADTGPGTPGWLNVYAQVVADGTDSDNRIFTAMEWQCYDVHNSHFNRYTNIVCAHHLSYGNEFSNTAQSSVTPDHGNVFEENGSVQNAGPNAWFNNLVHDNNNGVTIWLNPQVGSTDYSFGNILWNNQNSANTFNVGDNGGPIGNQVIFNNTFENPENSTVMRCQPSAVTYGVQQVNNHAITDGGSMTNCTSPQQTAFTTNLVQSHSTATGQGYTSSETFVYSPTLVTNSTVAAGTNEVSGYCAALTSGGNTLAGTACLSDTSYACAYNSSGNTLTCPTRTASTHPSSTAWDIGAFQFTGCPATYNFPGSGALNPADWTPSTVGGTSPLQEGSSTAFPSTASTEGSSIWIGSSCTPGNDHYSQAVLATAYSAATGVMVRADAFGNGYLFAPGITGIYKLTAFAGSAIATCPSIAVGHTIELAANGTTFTGYDNGTPVCNGTDSTYATGNAGILVDRRGTSTDSLGSFQVGVSPPVPLLNPIAALSTAVFMNADGVNFSYPFIGFNPTYQQATKLRFIPSNIKDVFYSAATPVPICYTTDGSTPTTPVTPNGTCTHGTLYTFNAGPSGLINFDGSTVIKLLSTATGFTNSGVTTINLAITPMYPYPHPYSYSPLLVTLNGTYLSNLIYTTNGSTPTASGTCTATNGTAVANGAQITLANSATTTVKFIPCIGGVTGSMQTGVYTQQAQRTWYVDTTANGGGTRYSANMTSGQCNGLATTPYVSGTNQPCPFNDVRYLWDDDSGVVGIGQWVIAGGDIALIKGCTALATQSNPSNPNCRIGWDENNGGGINNNWCNSVGNQGCTNPWIPAGSPTQNTQILGKNFAACPTGGQTNPRNYAGQLTQIFGGMGLTNIFDASDTQNITFSCLEITSHNGVCSTSGTPNYPRSCARNIPVDDYAQDGILTTNQTTGLTLTDVYIHGLNASGVQGPFGAGIAPIRVFSGFNGFAAWNMDDGFSTPDGVGATMTASYVTMVGNGCYEQYPIVNTQFSAQACWDTTTNGFGDAWSGQDTILDLFKCDHCVMDFNTKDATIGPHPAATSIVITNSEVQGNMGSAWKWISNINGTLDFHDNVSIFNCQRMSEALPGSAQNFNLNTGLGGSYLNPAGGFCRAGGNGFAANLVAGANWQIYNNTFISNSDNGYQAFLACGNAYNTPSGTCGTATLLWTNNIFIGYQMNGQPNGPALFGVNDVTVVPTWQNNISLGEKAGTGLPCGTAGNQCTSPLLVSQPPQTPLPTTETFLDNFNFNITGSSPAIMAGTTPCATVDFANNAQTSPCTIGALIFASGPPTVAIPTASPVAGTYTSTQSVTLSTVTGGATICYTTNGTTPAATTPGTCDVGSTTYSGAITVSVTTTIKALGTLSGDINSGVATFVYTIAPIVATPTASPVAGTYTSTQSVTLSDATGGASICYTTDGSTPTAPVAGTCSGGTTLTYSSAITVATTTTIKAIGTLSGDTNSAVGTFAYIIAPIVATPTCSPVAGTYSSTQSVTCSTVTAGSTICGTINGSTPTSSPAGTCSNGTSGPFVISSTATLKAIGTKSGDTDSSVFSGLYTITTAPPFIINGVIIIGQPILK